MTVHNTTNIKDKMNDKSETNGQDKMSDNEDPGPPPNDRDAMSAMARKREKNNEIVAKKIQECQLTGASCLDLCKRGLVTISNEILELVQLQYLYLENNELTSLPDNFFDCLTNLKWLDLRRNYLVSLPSTYIGRHQNLQNILLEGNELKTLPLELGLIPTLTGLNICNNPLDFPPAEIIERGTPTILAFLREMIKAKSQGKLLPGGPRLEDLKLRDNSDSDSYASEDDGLDHSFGGNKQKYGLEHSPHSSSKSLRKRDSYGSASDANSDLVGPVPQSMSLHQPITYNDLKKEQLERFEKAGALGTRQSTAGSKKKKKKKKRLVEISQYPSPPPQERIEQRFMEERRIAQLRDMKEKQELILQRRRDAELLREWRNDTKQLQQEKYREAYIYGGAKDPVNVAEEAPFAVAKNHMRIPTNEQRIKEGVKQKHEEIRRVISPRSQIRMEQERVERDHELQRRIKSHMNVMHDRRRQPKGTPQEEMEQARRELQVAEQLQKEIEARRKALEYRFTAFTGDSI